MKSRPTVIFMVGCSGAGKSRYAKQFAVQHPSYVYIGVDEIRRELSLKSGVQLKAYVFEKKYKDVVKKEYKRRVEEASLAGKNIIIDKTHLTQKEREQTAGYLKGDYKKIAVVVNGRIEEILANIFARNLRYAMQVVQERNTVLNGTSYEFVREQYRKLEKPTVAEGFSKILTVPVKVVPRMRVGNNKAFYNLGYDLAKMISHATLVSGEIFSRGVEEYARLLKVQSSAQARLLSGFSDKTGGQQQQPEPFSIAVQQQQKTSWRGMVPSSWRVKATNNPKTAFAVSDTRFNSAVNLRQPEKFGTHGKMLLDVDQGIQSRRK